MNRHSLTSLETARSLANGPSCGGGGGVLLRKKYVRSMYSPGIAASPISVLSIGGVCGRSLTAGKILFTGRQTCSLYLVLWLCALRYSGSSSNWAWSTKNVFKVYFIFQWYIRYGTWNEWLWITMMLCIATYYNIFVLWKYDLMTETDY